MDFTKYNNIISSLLSLIEAYQVEFIKSHPVYFQGLKTHSSVPTKNSTADKLLIKPADRAESWSDTGLISSDLPFSVQINDYVGPLGKGWEVVFITSDGVDDYICVKGFGPESRTKDWFKHPKING